MDHLDELERLERLRSSGALTDAEFDAHKRVLLNAPQPPKRRWIIFIVIPAVLVLVACALFMSRGDAPVVAAEDAAAPAADDGAFSSEPVSTTAGLDTAGGASGSGQDTTAMGQPPGFSPAEQALIDKWESLNGDCRGGSGDDPATMQSCEERDAVYEQLGRMNICYGRDDEVAAEHEMHRCEPNSLR